MREVSGSWLFSLQKIDREKQLRISFVVDYPAHVLLRLLNSVDEEVKVLIDEKLRQGEYVMTFEFDHLQPASYKIRLIIETDKAIDKETKIIQL